VARIVAAHGNLATAGTENAITLTLADEIDVTRGAILSRPEERPQVAVQFAPSCSANFSRCQAYMAISYRTLIWLHWLWSTGLRCAPRTVILRGFAVCIGLIPSRPEDGRTKPMVIWLVRR